MYRNALSKIQNTTVIDIQTYNASNIQIRQTNNVQLTGYLYLFSVRFQENYLQPWGRPEVLQNGVWSSVCDLNWDNKDATVLCKQMGYRRGIALCCSKLGGEIPITDMSVTNFGCNGTEKNILDCSKTIRRFRCNSQHQASAVCFNTTAPQNESK